LTRTKKDAIARSFRDACLAELDALKPGNVHRHGAGHGMSVADFEKSAEMAAPVIGRTGLSVGTRIKLAVEATRGAVGHNTNLGIILLAAPLAQAALTTMPVATVPRTKSLRSAPKPSANGYMWITAPTPATSVIMKMAAPTAPV